MLATWTPFASCSTDTNTSCSEANRPADPAARVLLVWTAEAGWGETMVFR